jgi:hypothetical protein
MRIFSVLTLSVLVLQVLALHAFASEYDESPLMKCKVSDAKSSVLLKAPNKQETYMNEGRFKGLDILAFENSAGDNYSVTIKQNENLVVTATIPFYVDANLKLNHKGNLITVICLR